jgi:preprotein translocase subunit SecG
MQTILIVFHLFLAVGLIGLILIQHGKGADMGAAFGSGASGTVFGSKGSASFLTRMTAGMATLFFLTSMAMAYFATQHDEGSDVLKGLQQQQEQQQAPAVGVENKAETDVPPVSATTDMPPVDVKETPAPAQDTGASEVPTAPVAEPGDKAQTPSPQPAEAAPAEKPAQPADAGKSQ